jgi:hypothetical protein
MIGFDVRSRAALARAMLPWFALCFAISSIVMAKAAWRVLWLDWPIGQRMTALAWMTLATVTVAVGMMLVSIVIAGAYWGLSWIGRFMATHITRSRLAALFGIVGVGVFMYFAADLGARYRTREKEDSDRFGMAVGAMLITTGVILRVGGDRA